MKVFIIDPMSCEERIKSIAEFFEEMGDQVDYVRNQPQKTFETLVREAFVSIADADRIVAVRKDDGTFGEGTMYEIAFAEFIGKQITKFGKVDRERRNL